MSRFAPVNLSRILNWLTAVILLVVPFHAFLTVWLASLVGHYTLLRLWKEFLLVPLAAGAIYILVKDRRLTKKLWSLWLVKLMAFYFILLLACGLAALARHDVNGKAVWYGLLVDSRFLVFFLAVIVLAAKSDWLSTKWRKLLLGPAILVAAIAVLQYLVLPYDFLKHFGYGDSTISPYETINHNVNHIRVMSTLRGANPLGAYLIVSISGLAVYFFREQRRRLDKIIFGAGLLLALAFSFSRSAWLGAALAIAMIAWLSLKSDKLRETALWVMTGLVIIVSLLVIALRHNHTFQDIVLHTDSASTIAESSNQGHSAAFKAAAKDIIHHPLGGGVGTAGPQSIYNNHPAKIAEDYFLQVGQETGVAGMLLFIWICVSLGHNLYSRRKDPLALALLGALIGLSLVNLLSHAWEDDTLAYVFWGLAAISLAPAILTDSRKYKNGQKISQKT